MQRPIILNKFNLKNASRWFHYSEERAVTSLSLILLWKSVYDFKECGELLSQTR
jgi:hypothetical protein